MLSKHLPEPVITKFEVDFWNMTPPVNIKKYVPRKVEGHTICNKKFQDKYFENLADESIRYIEDNEIYQDYSEYENGHCMSCETGAYLCKECCIILCSSCYWEMKYGKCKKMKNYEERKKYYKCQNHIDLVVKHHGDESDILYLYKNKEAILKSHGLYSLLDWLPIYFDKHCDNIVLFNRNADSPSEYEFAVAASDTHGRLGIFFITEPFEDFLKEIEQYEKEYEECDKTDWQLFNEKPIKKYLIKRDKPTCYG